MTTTTTYANANDSYLAQTRARDSSLLLAER